MSESRNTTALCPLQTFRRNKYSQFFLDLIAVLSYEDAAVSPSIGGCGFDCELHDAAIVDDLLLQEALLVGLPVKPFVHGGTVARGIPYPAWQFFLPTLLHP